ncbi:hypothetical protein BDZ89DRAFT_1113656 [Hymenopellis radicata]|nr:hypothetical protein BDZ89DRAFT_1113656 [Hymenopellis radicata]
MSSSTTLKSDQNQLQGLFEWQQQKCQLQKLAKTVDSYAVPQPGSSSAAPPPGSTVGPYSVTVDTSLAELAMTSDVPGFAMSDIPDDIMDLSNLHLREDLVLKDAVMLPGLLEFFGKMCEGAAEVNTKLPPIDSGDVCGSVARKAVDRTHTETVIKSQRELQASYQPRETMAAAATVALLEHSESAWETDYLFWRDDPHAARRGGSLQSHLLLDRDSIRGQLYPGLRAAVDSGFIPCLLYHFSEQPLSNGLVTALEERCLRDEDFQWEHCKPRENTCRTSSCSAHFAKHGDFPRVGRLAGPDSALIADIITCVIPPSEGWASKNTNSQIKFRKQAKDLLTKVWTGLVAINGTFAIVGDGTKEFIFIRRRKSQTLFISKCGEIARDPCSRRIPSYMKVRIGVNIAATLDVAARGCFWQQAARLDVQVPFNALSRHLNVTVPTDRLTRHFLQAQTLESLWKPTPTVLKHLSHPAQPCQVPAEGVISTINFSQKWACTDPGFVPPAIEGKGIDIFCLGDTLYRGEAHLPIEVESLVSLPTGTSEWEVVRVLTQVAVGGAEGEQLVKEYQHRLRISATPASRILPNVYGIFGNCDQDVYLLMLQYIGMPLSQYLDFLGDAFSGADRPELIRRLMSSRLVVELGSAIVSLHGTRHTHGGLFTTSDILVAFNDRDRTLRVMFKNLRDMRWWPGTLIAPEEAFLRTRDTTMMEKLVKEVYERFGLSQRTRIVGM